MRLIEFKKQSMPFANAPLVETRKKGHSQIPLKMSYTYQYLCCIPAAYVLHSM